MRAISLLLFICLSSAQAAAQDERQCSQAIAEAQKTAKNLPAKTEREKADIQKLIQKQEKLIADGRKQGLSECQIWGQVMGNAFNS